MVPFVTSNQVLLENNQIFQWPNYPNGIATRQIPVAGTEIVNSFWRIPKTLGNRVIGYSELLATDAVKPTPDAVKVLRVKTSDNTTYEFAIIDADHIASTDPADRFAYLANGLGGSLPVMPTVTIPTPIMQSDPQSVVDGDNTFVFAFPANPLGLLYSIPFPWFNGVAPTQAYEPAGITTAALFVTWANTSGKWDGYGTWSSVGDVISLLSTSSDTVYVLRAGMQITLTAAHFCLTLNASPDAVNGIKISGHNYTFGAIIAGRTNRQDLINAITKFLPGATFTTAVANKIDVLTTQLPQNITNNGSNVSGLNWVAGVCS